jgi:hypothetical protein
MINTIDEYLEALKVEMQGSDPALLQDALADAREHLSAALAAAREGRTDLKETDVLTAVVDEYGTPEETAAAYRVVERRTTPMLKQSVKPRSFLGRLLGVYVDPRTWGSLLFMFIAFVTGIIYFSWAVTGVSLSISLLILIIGLPFAILFLLSVQGLTLLEGRLVEGLLGIRMPRRLAFAQPGLNWRERLRALLTDRHTWFSLLYMLLQLPLGVLYFTLNTTLITFSIAMMVAPLGELFLKNSNLILEAQWSNLPGWALILLSLSGFLILTLTMHLARTVGWLHGRYAKAMLVN